MQSKKSYGVRLRRPSPTISPRKFLLVTLSVVLAMSMFSLNALLASINAFGDPVEEVGDPSDETQTNTYTVTFYVNGSEVAAIPVNEEKVVYEGTVSEPIMAGYDFAGWFTDPAGLPGTEFIFGIPLIENVDVYAVFIEPRISEGSGDPEGLEGAGEGGMSVLGDLLDFLGATDPAQPPSTSTNNWSSLWSNALLASVLEGSEELIDSGLSSTSDNNQLNYMYWNPYTNILYLFTWHKFNTNPYVFRIDVDDNGITRIGQSVFLDEADPHNAQHRVIAVEMPDGLSENLELIITYLDPDNGNATSPGVGNTIMNGRTRLPVPPLPALNKTTIDVVITGNTLTGIYNGSMFSVSGFSYTNNTLVSVTLKTGELAYAEGIDVDNYPMGLTIDMFDITILDPINYQLGVAKLSGDGWLKIIQRDIKIRIDDKTKTYGEADPFFTFTLTEGTLANPNDDLGIVIYRTNVGVEAAGPDPTYTYTSVLREHPTLSSRNSNYRFIEVLEGDFTIIPKEITITVNDASKVFETADPVFTGEVSGLLSTEPDALGTITYYRSNPTINAVGTYPSVLSVNYTANPNYHVIVYYGTFTIADAVPPTPPTPPTPPAPVIPVVTPETIEEDPLEEIMPVVTTTIIEPEMSLAVPVPTLITEAISDTTVPLVQFNLSSWALLNLIFVVVSVLLALALLALHFRKRRELESIREVEERRTRIVLTRATDNTNSTEEPKNRIQRLVGRIVAAVFAIAAIALFILTEDMGSQMIFLDQWTFVHMSILFLQLVCCVLVSRGKQIKTGCGFAFGQSAQE